MHILKKIQEELEEFYQAPTGLNILDFVKSQKNFSNKGSLLVKKEKTSNNLELAVVFDRDVLAAWDAHHQNASICFEEASHFVYLSHNHFRNRNVTTLEMEIQSEIDRLFLAFHSKLSLKSDLKKHILQSFLRRPYLDEAYERSRKIARRLILSLSGGKPSAWTKQEMRVIRKFFHSDLGEKIYLSKTYRGNF